MSADPTRPGYQGAVQDCRGRTFLRPLRPGEAASGTALVLGDPAPLTRPVAWLAEDGAALGAELQPDALGRPSWVLVRRVPALPRRADGTPDLGRLAAGDLGQRRAPRDETERRVA